MAKPNNEKINSDNIVYAVETAEKATSTTLFSILFDSYIKDSRNVFFMAASSMPRGRIKEREARRIRPRA
jgi:hypothetical protein